MSDQSPRASRTLPTAPNLRHLKDQARDLVRAGDTKTLSQAQLRIAREYGFGSWAKLKAHVESLTEIGQLKAAIDAKDLVRVQALMTRNPALHRAPLGYGNNGPLTWVAECRVPREAPSETRLEMARWMIENGSDVHQGGDGPLMRASLSDTRLPMMELLLAHGADPKSMWGGHYPVIFAPCETLQPRALQLLIERGADMHTVSAEHGTCVGMLIGTYWRNPPGKHACLEVFAHAGFQFPNSAPVAIHRGRIDLLADLIDRDPALIHRRFRETEIFPPELCRTGLHVAPLEGGTLLHLAVEYWETEIVRWLINRGADVNARSTIDPEGFGGHTPLFHTTVTLALKSDDTLARLLLHSGADPNLRATFRKQLSGMGDGEQGQMREYHNATSVDFARQFQVPEWANEGAIAAIREQSGHDY